MYKETKISKSYNYTVILEPETDPEFKGYYNASVPALQGCFSYGRTKKEAVKNIREAILCYLEDLKKRERIYSQGYIPRRYKNRS